MTLIDIIGLVEDANYKIQELEEKIEDLETPDEEEDFSYSGGDLRNL